MPQQNDPKKDQKQVLSTEDIEFVNRNLEEKYEELMRTSSLLKSEKTKWKATFDEFDEFYNNAPCGYHTIDDSGLILKMNQTELNWLGYKREEVINKMNILDFLSQRSNILFYKYIPLLREKGRADQLEVEYVRRDGTILTTLVSSIAIFDENNNFKCVRSALWDISDRKKMEDEMLKVNRHLRAVKERFDEKNTLVQKLNEELQVLKKNQNELYISSGINIAQPLEKILNLCITAIGSSSPDNEVYRNLLQIQNTANQVSRFVSHLRMHKRVSSENAILEVSSFNLSSLLITVVNRLEELAAKKKVTINCEIFEDILINSDKDILGQLIDTLLSSIIKLSAPGKEIPLRLIRKINEYVVELEIHGLTVSRKEIVDLFDKTKPHSSVDGKEGGMVLDSHLIISLVDNLGFELNVSPVNHKGTLIRLVMPAAKVS